MVRTAKDWFNLFWPEPNSASHAERQAQKLRDNGVRDVIVVPRRGAEDGVDGTFVIWSKPE